jgi:hypothetical protein
MWLGQLDESGNIESFITLEDGGNLSKNKMYYVFVEEMGQDLKIITIDYKSFDCDTTEDEVIFDAANNMLRDYKLVKYH